MAILWGRNCQDTLLSDACQLKQKYLSIVLAIWHMMYVSESKAEPSCHQAVVMFRILRGSNLAIEAAKIGLAQRSFASTSQSRPQLLWCPLRTSGLGSDHTWCLPSKKNNILSNQTPETCVDKCTSLHPIECFFLQSLFGLQSHNCTFLLVCQTEGLQVHTNPNICKNPPDHTWCKLNAKLLSTSFSLTIFSLSFSSFFWASCPIDAAPTMTLTWNSFDTTHSAHLTPRLICPHVGSTKHTKQIQCIVGRWMNMQWHAATAHRSATHKYANWSIYIAIPLLLVAFRGVVQMSVSGSSQEICDTVCDIRKSSPQLFKYNPRSNHVTLERASWFCTFFRSKIIAHFCQLARWTKNETHGKLLIGLKQSTKHNEMIQILMFVLKKQTNNWCRWGRTLGS